MCVWEKEKKRRAGIPNVGRIKEREQWEKKSSSSSIVVVALKYVDLQTNIQKKKILSPHQQITFIVIEFYYPNLFFFF